MLKTEKRAILSYRNMNFIEKKKTTSRPPNDFNLCLMERESFDFRKTAVEWYNEKDRKTWSYNTVL